MPSNPIQNYVFENTKNLLYTDKTEEWLPSIKSFSNGMAYADLDNDGDMDIVINNINSKAILLENKTNDIYTRNYLKFKLLGKSKNTFSIGAKILLKHKDNTYFLEQMPRRGFLSSVGPVLHFGLDTIETIDTVQVVWPSGKTKLLTNIPTNQTITLKEPNEGDYSREREIFSKKLFYKKNNEEVGIDYTHKENDFVDFNREPLMPHMLSREGPKIASGDVNRDGLIDLYFCGG